MKNPNNIPSLSEKKVSLTEEDIYPTSNLIYATQSIGTDRNPYQVIEIKNARHIVVRSLLAFPDIENGYDYYGNQEYIFRSNPNGKIVEVTKRKDGYWYEKRGRRTMPFHLSSQPSKYRDPHF